MIYYRYPAQPYYHMPQNFNPNPPNDIGYDDVRVNPRRGHAANAVDNTSIEFRTRPRQALY